MVVTSEPIAQLVDVVVVDKSPLVVDGLCELFSRDDRIASVAAVAGIDELAVRWRQNGFHVAVIGWVLGEGGGRSFLESLDHDAGPRFVVYTGDPDPSIPRTVMALGGAGFCSKTEPTERLVEIVVAVSRGQMVFPFLDVRRPHDDLLGSLTAREFALVEALADGHSNKSLANMFGVTVNTVKFHLRNAYVKLDARNRAQAVAVFLQSKNGR